MNQVIINRKVAVTVIPDGVPGTLDPGQPVHIHQNLGGSFTVTTEDGRKFRIEGLDADAIGQEIPDEAKMVEAEGEPLGPEEAEKKGWEMLKAVHDPEIPVDVVELGLIYELKMHVRGDGKLLAAVKMTLTAPGCGMGDVLVRDVERQLKRIPGVATVDAKIVFDPVWNPHKHMSTAAKLKLGLL